MSSILNYKGKYIPTEIIQNHCFTKGNINHIDKVSCGCGFTTGFLKLQVPKDKINIIIAPNKAVVVSKQIEYLENPEFKFFYKESSDNSFEGAKVLFFVADSFLHYQDKLEEIAHKVDKVLIDEYHSTEQQSTYRIILKQFIEKVKSILPTSAITTVTATPNRFSKIDLKLISDTIKPININISKNRENALERIKNNLKANENVIVFTNNKSVIHKLKNYKKELKAKFVVGENLMRSVVEGATIQPNEKSNLVIVSSRGFEGFDLHLDNAKVYLFEDRTNEHETFYLSNLYQAIHRNRLANSYIEYCRNEVSNKRKGFKNIDKAINRFIKRTDISAEKKQNSEYKEYKDFIIFEADENGTFTLRKNEVAIALEKEKQLYDYPNIEANFSEFLNDRQVTFTYVNEFNNRLANKKDSKQIQKYLKSNEDLIRNNNLFGNGYNLQVVNLYNHRSTSQEVLLKMYSEHFDKYLRRKNYALDRHLTDRERTANILLKNKSQMDRLVKKVVGQYKNRASEKYKAREVSAKVKEFESKAFNLVCIFTLAFANEKIKFPKKEIAHRDYNITTELGLSLIEIIAERFGIEVTEVDIATCNPRILYALMSLVLPKLFYGKNKINKTAINVALNSFRYDSLNKTELKKQKYIKIQSLLDLGVHKKVVEYLEEHFFESKHRDKLFNHLAYHEKQIIDEVKHLVGTSNDGVVRRHDSILIFNNREDLSHLNNYTYKGVGGWFNIEDDRVINISENRDKNNEDLNTKLTGTNGMILM